MSMNLSGISQNEYQDAIRTRSFTEQLVRRVPAWPFVFPCVLGDFLIVVIITLSLHPLPNGQTPLPLINIIATLALAVMCLLAYQQGGLYDICMLRHGARSIGRLLTRWSFLCLVILASSAILRNADAIQFCHLFLFFVTGLSGFVLERLAIEYALRHWTARGNYIHSVAIVGDEAEAEAIAEKLKPASGIRVSRMFRDDHKPADISSFSGNDQSLLDPIGGGGIDTVIIATQALAPNRLSALLRLLRKHPINIYATPESLFLPKISCIWQNQDSFPELNLIPLASFPINKAAFLVKNVIDRLVALLILLFVSPIMLACAIGIGISDPGPIFFSQQRTGYKGREFAILKFRTMYVTPKPNTELTIRNDPRIFPFGRFLRKTSLDELPQLLNVLMGDMSLVGPRPHMPEATVAGVRYFEAVGDYSARHRVKPGITGWAQVNGWRGPTETIDQIQSRVAHDLYYIENWSFVLDFTVLLKTAFVLFGKNVF